LGGFESYVYEYEGAAVILKITHSMRRSKEYVMGESESQQETIKRIRHRIETERSIVEIDFEQFG